MNMNREKLLFWSGIGVINIILFFSIFLLTQDISLTILFIIGGLIFFGSVVEFLWIFNYMNKYSVDINKKNLRGFCILVLGFSIFSLAFLLGVHYIDTAINLDLILFKIVQIIAMGGIIVFVIGICLLVEESEENKNE